MLSPPLQAGEKAEKDDLCAFPRCRRGRKPKRTIYALSPAEGGRKPKRTSYALFPRRRREKAEKDYLCAFPPPKAGRKPIEMTASDLKG